MTDRIPLDHLTSDALDDLYDERDALASDLAELTQARQHGAFTFCPQLVGHVTVAEFARKISEKRTALAQREEAVRYANEQKQRADQLHTQITALRDDLYEITGARWIADMLDTILNQPASAATQATKPREHCGDLKPQFSETNERTECMLRPGHTGSHADHNDTRWWWTDQPPTQEPNMIPCTATIEGPNTPGGRLIQCTREAGHPENHVGPQQGNDGKVLWTDHNAGATPHRGTDREQQ